MTDLSCKMMMESGVLRPGDQVIRRSTNRGQLYVTREVSDYLNRSVEVLFGSESKAHLQKTTNGVHPSQFHPSLPPSSRFSWKGLVKRIAGHHPSSCPETSLPELLVTRLEGRVRQLELLLESEQALCETQRHELASQSNRIDIIEAELAIERESGARLVKWLREAEQELSEIRRLLIGRDTDAQP